MSEKRVWQTIRRKVEKLYIDYIYKYIYIYIYIYICSCARSIVTILLMIIEI